jgi:hypothetical protein
MLSLIYTPGQCFLSADFLAGQCSMVQACNYAIESKAHIPQVNFGCKLFGILVIYVCCLEAGRQTFIESFRVLWRTNNSQFGSKLLSPSAFDSQKFQWVAESPKRSGKCFWEFLIINIHCLDKIAFWWRWSDHFSNWWTKSPCSISYAANWSKLLALLCLIFLIF